MKKKISLFVLCGVVLLGVCGCSDEETKQLNCEAFKDVKYVIDETHFLTNDDDLYSWSHQLYTNNTNCKKMNEEDLKIVKRIGYYVLGNDNNLYAFTSNESHSTEISDYKSYFEYDDMIYGSSDGSDKVVLKKDGKLYTKVNGELKIYKDFEGEIIIDYNIAPIGTFIKTNKAYYNMQYTNREECKKYADVACKYELAKNEQLTSIYDDISIYYGFDWYITKDGKEHFISDLYWN